MTKIYADTDADFDRFLADQLAARESQTVKTANTHAQIRAIKEVQRRVAATR